MKARYLHLGYHLAAITTKTEDGRFRARVAIMALSGDRTRSQRFVDFEVFSTEALADERAIAGGREWIDTHTMQERLGADTNFSVLT
jgi:hypothetical protein